MTVPRLQCACGTATASRATVRVTNPSPSSRGDQAEDPERYRAPPPFDRRQARHHPPARRPRITYHDPDGRRIKDRETLDRIRKLAVPPAWTDVWICPDPLGHLQATGHDARGRKQYRYHTRFRERRETDKYERLVTFARALPAIRRQVDRDLARPGLPREKVLAAVVRLLELTLICVGNDEYRRLNRSFGLTTLHDRHATVSGTSIRFRFKGKSGRQHEVGLRDRRLATVIQRCQDLPGQDLFQYEGEDGEPVDIASDDVNAYLQSIAPDVTAKDFRTWAGTVLAYRALRALDEPETATEAKQNVVSAIRDTADQLGNTAAVCRRSYVHPVVVRRTWTRGWSSARRGRGDWAAGRDDAAGGTRGGRLLERRLGRDAARAASAAGRTR